MEPSPYPPAPLFLDPGAPPRSPEDLLSLYRSGCSLVTVGDDWAPADDGRTHIFQQLQAQAGSQVPLAGRLGPTGLEWEPFGEMTYLELSDLYAERALALQALGASLLELGPMPSLEESRFALLGSRQSGLPVWVLLPLNAEGLLPDGGDPLAVLAVLQSLGAAGLVLLCEGGNLDALKAVGRLYPLAQLPLAVQVNAEENGASLSPEELAERARQLLRTGAQGLMAGSDMTAEQVAVLRQVLDSFDPSSRVLDKEEGVLLMANDRQPFFLTPERLSFSPPIECAWDMSEALLDAEEGGWEVLTIHLTSTEDGHLMGRNAHMAGLPLAFSADHEEALESALLHYHGRAFVDSRCELAPSVLEQLCTGYGAVLI